MTYAVNHARIRIVFPVLNAFNSRLYWHRPRLRGRAAGEEKKTKKSTEKKRSQEKKQTKPRRRWIRTL